MKNFIKLFIYLLLMAFLLIPSSAIALNLPIHLSDSYSGDVDGTGEFITGDSGNVVHGVVQFLNSRNRFVERRWPDIIFSAGFFHPTPYTPAPVSIPEPGVMVLLGTALLGVAGLRKKNVFR